MPLLFLIFILSPFMIKKTTHPIVPSAAPGSLNSATESALKTDIERLKKEVQASRDSQDWWNKWYLRLAMGAVILGVASWFFQKHASDLELGNRPRSDDLNHKTERLKELQNQDSEYQLGLVKKDASDAIERTGHAEERIAEANERAESEHLARVKIEERLAWRRVSVHQYAKFSKDLQPFAGAKVVVFVFNNEDIEAKTLAGDLVHLLHDGASWEAILNDTNTAIPLPTGITCELDTSQAAGKALAEVMTSFAEAVIVPRRMPGMIGVIRIGLRPPP